MDTAGSLKRSFESQAWLHDLSRPSLIMKNSFYFPHDCNARNDNKLIQLRMKHGMRGYGIYFGIIELLMEANSYQLPLNYQSIAYDLREDAKDIEDIVNQYGLFTVNCTVFWSDSLKARMKKREQVSERRSVAGKKGAEVTKQKRTPSLNKAFEEVWQQYPSIRRIGKKLALTHYMASVKNDEDQIRILKALTHYKASSEVSKGFIQNASTWFNNWPDWVEINTTVDNDGIPESCKTKPNLLRK